MFHYSICNIADESVFKNNVKPLKNLFLKLEKKNCCMM